MAETNDDLERGLALQQAGRLDEAESAYRSVLAGAPGNADALHLLGMIAFQRGDAGAAVSLVGSAVLASPAEPLFHANLAVCHLALRDYGSAISHARRAAELDPGMAEAHYNLGNALFAAGDTEGAVDHFKTARDLDPDNGNYQTNYLFALNFSDRSGRQTVYDENCLWGDRVESSVAPGAPRTNRETGRRLRIAYYLPELDQHVTYRFLVPVLRHHDTHAFEVSVHVSGRGQARAAAELPGIGWQPVDGMTDAEIAAGMRDRAVDILVHPCTFKARYRTLLAHRAAPVQVAAVNLVSTTGFAAADYVFTDGILDPEGETERFYRERLVRLSRLNTYQIPADAPDVAPPPVLENGYFTFGSCNNPAKYSDATFAAWAACLENVPGNRLLLKHRAFDGSEARGRVTDAFARLGVDASRLDFEGYTSDVADYLAVYHRIDVCLDPIPFGGGTTSYEALWMGAPVLTVLGDSLMGRLTASLMTGLGLARFVAADGAGMATAAASITPEELAALRAGLRSRAANTLFDHEAFTREFEGALREVWRRHCAAPAGRAG